MVERQYNNIFANHFSIEFRTEFDTNAQNKIIFSGKITHSLKLYYGDNDFAFHNWKNAFHNWEIAFHNWKIASRKWESACENWETASRISDFCILYLIFLQPHFGILHSCFGISHPKFGKMHSWFRIFLEYSSDSFIWHSK